MEQKKGGAQKKNWNFRFFFGGGAMVKTTGRYLFQNGPYNRTLRSKVKNRIFLGRHRGGGF